MFLLPDENAERSVLAHKQYQSFLDSDIVTFWDLIDSYMYVYGLSRSAFGNIVGVSYACIHSYTNRRMCPHPNRIPSIAERMGVDLMVMSHIIVTSRNDFKRLSRLAYVLRVVSRALGLSMQEMFDAAGYDERAYAPLTGDVIVLEDYACDAVSDLFDVSVSTIQEWAHDMKTSYHADFEFLYKMYDKVAGKIDALRKLVYLPSYADLPELERVESELQWLREQHVTTYVQLVDSYIKYNRMTYGDYCAKVYGHRAMGALDDVTGLNSWIVPKACAVLNVHPVILVTLLFNTSEKSADNSLKWLVYFVVYVTATSLEDVSRVAFEGNKYMLRNLVANYRAHIAEEYAVVISRLFGIAVEDVEVLHTSYGVVSPEVILKACDSLCKEIHLFGERLKC